MGSVAEEADELILQEVGEVLRGVRRSVATSVNSAMVEAYWEVGRQISEAIGDRAEYGKNLIRYLSERLTIVFGKGFTVANLRNMRQFYQVFPIRYALRSELTWTHYRSLMRLDEPKRREFYFNEAADQGWTSRQMERQINSFYYERLLATKKERRAELEGKIFELEPRTDADYILKDPYVLEFLNLEEPFDHSETDIEQGLINKLQDFLLELGKGFSFVGRQKRITTESGSHYYIDLVFYNYILKCFVVVDIKAGSLTYQDIGQIDFYVRLFDDKVKQPDDNPTIGLVLVTGKTKLWPSTQC
jgi:predicted nuclease of restriction endonuclease-like (RecB) superfamily